MATGFRADSAMVMHRCVKLTLVCTELTREDARVKLSVEQFIRSFRLARQQPRRDRANIGAVQVRPNASAKFGHVLALVEASVSARGAYLHTEAEGIEDVCIVIGTLQIRVRMAAQHGVDEIHDKNYANSSLLPSEKYRSAQ